MRHFMSILVLLLTGMTSKGQRVSELKSVILSADTIFLVSHKQTDCIVIVDKKTGEIILDDSPGLPATRLSFIGSSSIQ
jgi:hypothetical protein